MLNQPNLAARLKDLEENPNLISFYTKRNCKDCRGTGSITRSVPTGDGTWSFVTETCACVKKAIKKELVNG